MIRISLLQREAASCAVGCVNAGAILLNVTRAHACMYTRVCMYVLVLLLLLVMVVRAKNMRFQTLPLLLLPPLPLLPQHKVPLHTQGAATNGAAAHANGAVTWNSLLPSSR